MIDCSGYSPSPFWMNVLLDGRDNEEGNDISLAELTVGEELQRWAVMVTFRPADVEAG